MHSDPIRNKRAVRRDYWKPVEGADAWRRRAVYIVRMGNILRIRSFYMYRYLIWGLLLAIALQAVSVKGSVEIHAGTNESGIAQIVPHLRMSD